MHSALVLDKAIVGCFLADQDITAPQNMKVYLVTDLCHGMTSPPLLHPPLATSTPPLPPPLCSNSEAYLCNLYNYITPSLRLTTDQYWTHSDLVPTPRATIYIPFLHLSYLPDPFSLTIMGNYSFLV